jgi:hypothetical protein
LVNESLLCLLEQSFHLKACPFFRNRLSSGLRFGVEQKIEKQYDGVVDAFWLWLAIAERKT